MKKKYFPKSIEYEEVYQDIYADISTQISHGYGYGLFVFETFFAVLLMAFLFEGEYDSIMHRFYSSVLWAAIYGFVGSILYMMTIGRSNTINNTMLKIVARLVSPGIVLTKKLYRVARSIHVSIWNRKNKSSLEREFRLNPSDFSFIGRNPCMKAYDALLELKAYDVFESALDDRIHTHLCSKTLLLFKSEDNHILRKVEQKGSEFALHATYLLANKPDESK